MADNYNATEPGSGRAFRGKELSSGKISPTHNLSETPSNSNVNGSATSVTLLSANTNRIGVTFFNDSTANLYIKLGVTASSTSFTAKVAPGGLYEVPFGYVGRIDGIWDSANGAVRITELS